jgi:hypothetical protein
MWNTTFALELFQASGVGAVPSLSVSLKENVMRHASLNAALCMSCFIFAPRAEAAVFMFGANLAGPNEVPPVASPGTGSALVTVDNVADTMRVQLTFAGLTSNSTAAHIHCCAPLGTNAPVATTTPAFVGFPTGVTSGSLDQTYDMTLAGSYSAAFLSSNGGSTATAFSTLLTGLEAGQTYLNIHTVNHPGGEIRGQLSAVPEPVTWALMLVGFGVVGGAMRRRRCQMANYIRA